MPPGSHFSQQESYDPKQVEARWYQKWEQEGVFRPEINPEGEPFTIVIPPPNVTGLLHMGHALDHSIQDALIRRKRMQGYAALWLPGTDHAGIATQMVVERELAVEGISRHDLGREAFIEKVWEWRRKSGGAITKQMRALGDSCDWSRERFTLDEGLSAAVREVFVSLYEKGHIYRGRRIINWSPGLRTAISDIEVEFRETVGRLTYINYPFVGGEGAITVATTRPETMLGDTAVAVHPGDERYQGMVGSKVVLPLMGREIPVVADEAVDPEFGTGAVKVTPAHDPLDFAIAERAGLEPIQVIGEDARMTEQAGEFAGLDRFEARSEVVDALEAGGYIEKTEEHRHAVGHCSRSGTQVEPLLSEQWFVKVKGLVGPAVEVIRQDISRFVPRRWERNYFHWMEELQDWCISRQLWWGHRVPAWYCPKDGQVIVSRTDPQSCRQCGQTDLTPDPDVLDTWFSSALWPFSSLGWPQDTPDMRRFYPTNLLVTGFDIIFFWVARMLKMGLEFTGQAPFSDIVIHGLVRAADGQKMSKSAGNAMDPMEMIDQYGADSLRLSLLQAAAPGHDVPFDRQWVEAARRFGNKMWNAAKFIILHQKVGPVPASGGYPDNPSPVDTWILSRLNKVGTRVDELFESYRLSDAFSLLYNFSWSEVFDWYLEMTKPILSQDSSPAETARQTLGVVFRDLLKYFHPAIPFLTEELYGQLVGEGMCITAPWPQPPAYTAPDHMETLQELVGSLRRFRAEHQLPSGSQPEIIIHDPEGVWQDWWTVQCRSLAKVTPVLGDPPDQSGHSRVVAGSLSAFFSLGDRVDREVEINRLQGRLDQAQADWERSRRKLGNPDFCERAPAEVVAKERSRATESEVLIDKLTAQIEKLSG